MAECLADGVVDEQRLKLLRKKVKTRYRWQRIKPQVYAAAVYRFVVLSDRAGGQKLQEDGEVSYGDIAHGVSRRVVEGCLDAICHNVNVLDANNRIIHSMTGKYATEADNVVLNAFADNGIPNLWRRDAWSGKDIKDYGAAISLYIYWAAYAKGRAGDEFTCDSDNGPAEVRKVLDGVEYASGDVDLLVALNKALDVVHFRSGLAAAAFIEGGQRTCAMVSNMPAKFVV